MNKDIYVVTHPREWETQPDPSLTAEGEETAGKAAAAKLLPRQPAQVICGTGRRYFQTAKIFGLTPTHFSPLCGVPDASVYVPGSSKIVRFADGDTRCRIDQWLIPNTRPFLNTLEHNTVLIAGRTFMLGLGFRGAHRGMIFKIVFETDEVSKISDIDDFVELFPNNREKEFKESKRREASRLTETATA